MRSSRPSSGSCPGCLAFQTLALEVLRPLLVVFGAAVGSRSAPVCMPTTQVAFRPARRHRRIGHRWRGPAIPRWRLQLPLLRSIERGRATRTNTFRRTAMAGFTGAIVEW